MAKLPKLSILGLICLVGQVAGAQEVAQDIPGHGKINYTDKTITVTGTGAPNLKAPNAAVARIGAERAAKMDAWRNILEAVKGVKVSGTSTAGSVMAASPQVRSRVEGVIRNFKVLDTKYYSDGGVDLIVQVPLSGVTDALVPDAGTKTTNAGAGGGTTGIIVNASGLSVAPALAPRILDEAGKEVFSAAYVAKENVVKTTGGGVCGYSSNLDTAKKDPRVAGKPLVIKALRVPEAGSADLIISNADAAKLQKLGGVLSNGSVIIVTG